MICKKENDNFLNEISFKEDFPPFPKNTKVCFKNDMQDIIKFYLENKGIENNFSIKSLLEQLNKKKIKELKKNIRIYREKYKKIDLKKIDKKLINKNGCNLRNYFNKREVSKRLKINLIVGENGTGKSGLLDNIYISLGNNKNTYIKVTNPNNFSKNKWHIFKDNLSIFDYTRDKINKNNRSQSVSNFMEFTKWSHPIGIVGRYLIYLAFYIGLIKQGKIKDFLGKNIIGVDLLKENIDFTITNNIEKLVNDLKTSNFKITDDMKKKINNFKKIITNLNKEISNIEIKGNEHYSKKEIGYIKRIDSKIGNINNIIAYIENPQTIEKFNKINYDLLDIINYYSFILKPNKSISWSKIRDYINLNLIWITDKYSDLDFSDDIKKYFLNTSSGQKIFLLRFSFYLIEILLNKDKNKNFLILIDEPDLHLHLDWQRKYIQKLIDVFGNLLAQPGFEDINLHFIIATHSPFLLSDVPAENVILLKKAEDKDGKKYTKITDWWGKEFKNEEKILSKKDILRGLNNLANKKEKEDKKENIDLIKVIKEIISKIKKEYKKIEEIKSSELEEIIKEHKNLDNKDYCLLKKWLENNFGYKKEKSNKNTFGANFVDLIRNGFFFSNKNLMGSLSENVIGDIADLERDKIFLESLKFQKEYKGKNNEDLEKLINELKEKNKQINDSCDIKNKIGDSFLKDNLLYFKKKDAEDGDR